MQSQGRKKSKYINKTNNLLVDFNSATFIYVRVKGSIIRRPSLEHLNAVINELLKYSSTIFIGGDIDDLKIPQDTRIINIGSMHNHKELRISLPINCKYNISLGIGGGTHLPVLFKKPMLTIATYIGIIYPFSITLPGSIAKAKGLSSSDRIQAYINMSDELYAKGEKYQLALVEGKLIEIPSVQDTCRACKEYFERKAFLAQVIYLDKLLASKENFLKIQGIIL